MEIEQILDSIYPLPINSKQQLIESIKEVKYPKGYKIIEADKYEKNIYFMRKGIGRIYTPHLEDELTFLFCKEGDTIVSMKSYVFNQRGYENVELLEDSQLYELSTDALQKLLDYDINIANWSRKLAEIELIKTEERFISQQSRPAKERYMDILKNNPDLIQRVQLGYIASYLGITQVTLSRIRSTL